MRTNLVLASILAMLIAACSGGGAGPTGNPAATSGSNATKQPPGTIDCAVIDAAVQQLIAVQFLAQLTTPENVETIRSKQIGNLDLDMFLGAMEDLHALDDFDSPLGDAKSAIEVYQKAAEAAKDLFATEPVTQVAIDQYNENVGTVGEFLGHQVAIAGAKDEAGC